MPIIPKTEKREVYWAPSSRGWEVQEHSAGVWGGPLCSVHSMAEGKQAWNETSG
jgi:hypothetical protein